MKHIIKGYFWPLLNLQIPLTLSRLYGHEIWNSYFSPEYFPFSISPLSLSSLFSLSFTTTGLWYHWYFKPSILQLIYFLSFYPSLHFRAIRNALSPHICILKVFPSITSVTLYCSVCSFKIFFIVSFFSPWVLSVGIFKARG